MDFGIGNMLFVWVSSKCIVNALTRRLSVSLWKNFLFALNIFISKIMKFASELMPLTLLITCWSNRQVLTQNFNWAFTKFGSDRKRRRPILLSLGLFFEFLGINGCTVRVQYWFDLSNPWLDLVAWQGGLEIETRVVGWCGTITDKCRLNKKSCWFRMFIVCISMIWPAVRSSTASLDTVL